MKQPFDLSIKAARVESGFTQEALAEKMGVSKRTYVGWENGDVEIKPLVIFALAYIFGMEADRIRVPVKN